MIVFLFLCYPRQHNNHHPKQSQRILRRSDGIWIIGFADSEFLGKNIQKGTSTNNRTIIVKKPSRLNG